MKIVEDYGWSTHRPLIQAILDAFSPQFVLELGMGVYSTPIFMDYKPEAYWGSLVSRELCYAEALVPRRAIHNIRR